MYTVTGVYFWIIKIHHLHRDTIIIVIYGLNFRQDSFLLWIYDSKIEIFCFRQRTRNDTSVFYLKAGVRVLVVIPDDHFRINFTISSSNQIDSIGCCPVRRIVDCLIITHLWKKIASVGRVLQIVIIIGSSVRIFPFRELPYGCVYLASDPFDAVSVVIAPHERTVMIHCVILIFFGRVIPYSGIDNDFLSVAYIDWIRNADLFGLIEIKVFVLERGTFD